MISGIKVTGYHQSSGLFYVIIQCLSQHFFIKSVADAKPPPYLCALCVIVATCISRWFALLLFTNNEGKYKANLHTLVYLTPKKFGILTFGLLNKVQGYECG